MILKALCDYYDRHKDDLPAFGFEQKEIAFLIVIDNDGHFVRFEDRRIDAKHAQEFRVKKHVGRTSTAYRANFLYDNSDYVLGFANKEGKGNVRFEVFSKLVHATLEKDPCNADLNAIAKFYDQGWATIIAAAQADPLWETIEKNLDKKFSTFSFLIEGDSTIVAAKPEILKLSIDDRNRKMKRCLITGDYAPVVDITTATMIPGSQATAKLVSFNEDKGFDSYGKKQGQNAPISEEAEFRYSTALNAMLAKDSRHKFGFGNRTFVFWSSSTSDAGEKVEEGIFSLFGFKDNDLDAAATIDQVRKVFMSIYSGQMRTTLEDRFFILGLAPNSARIAVSYWAEIPLREFAALILRHFDDMEIIDTRKEKKPYYGAFSLMAATTPTWKASDASPNLAEQLVKSIFQGLPYPHALYMGALNRVRAGQSAINIAHAAIMKAYLNRLPYINNNKQLHIMLDKENTNQGYLCGRLFAVLDKIQYDANGISTIRERYMNSASATPAAVFATILNLSNHHAEKLSKGAQIYYEKMKQEIVSAIDATGFPAHLDLQDQGRFFVGYYHQRQEIFKSNDKTVVVTENE